METGDILILIFFGAVCLFSHLGEIVIKKNKENEKNRKG